MNVWLPPELALAVALAVGFYLVPMLFR